MPVRGVWGLAHGRGSTFLGVVVDDRVDDVPSEEVLPPNRMLVRSGAVHGMIS